MFEEKYSDELVYDIAQDKVQGMSIEMLAEKYSLTESQIEYIVYKRLRRENEERGLHKDAVVTLVDQKPEPTTTDTTITITGVSSSAEVNTTEPEVPAPPTNWFKRVWRFWFG